MQLQVATADTLRAVALSRYNAEANQIRQQPSWASKGARDAALFRSKQAHEAALDALDAIESAAKAREEQCRARPILKELHDHIRQPWLSLVQLVLARSKSPDVRAAIFADVKEMAPKDVDDAFAPFRGASEASSSIKDAAQKGLAGNDPIIYADAVAADREHQVKLQISSIVNLVTTILSFLTIKVSSTTISRFSNLRRALGRTTMDVGGRYIEMREIRNGQFVVEDAINISQAAGFPEFGEIAKRYGTRIAFLTIAISIWSAIDSETDASTQIVKALVTTAGGMMGASLTESIAQGAIGRLVQQFPSAAMILGFEEAMSLSAGCLTFGIGFVVGTIAAITTSMLWDAALGKSIPRELQVGIIAPISVNTEASIVASIVA